ncbi:MAG: hypothetical protein JSS09_03230 [Verrucomicrobia bacterium]|nr:hypothetical protein [Verrucomicrobiota bacterium]
MIITNLDRDNFLETKVSEAPEAVRKVAKKDYYEDVQSEFQGVHAFNKRDPHSLYN